MFNKIKGVLSMKNKKEKKAVKQISDFIKVLNNIRNIKPELDVSIVKAQGELMNLQVDLVDKIKKEG